MCVNGQGPAHCRINHHLARGVVQMIIPTDNMGHPHVMIVNNNCQHINGRAIRAQQNHIIQLVIAYCYIALDLIFDHRDPVNWGFNAHHKRRVRM